MRFAMADRSATLKFYGELLGFNLTGGAELNVNPVMSAFAPVPEGSKVRALNVIAPGTNPLLFYEFKDLPRTPFRLRVQDPGAPMMSLRVKDLDGLLKRLRAAGVPVLFNRGEVDQFTSTTRNVLVEDPNGIHIELYEQR